MATRSNGIGDIMINASSDIKAQENLSDTLGVVLNNLQANLHTQTIAKVMKVSAKTIDVKPVINRVVGDKVIELPTFIEVPPVFLSGGGSHITMPIAVGDYCLLLLTERCFDRWYHGDDFQPPLEYRMHDYSDGFALVGVAPKASALTIPDKITMVGDCIQTGDYTHSGDRVHTGVYTHTGDETQTGSKTLNGNETINGNLTVTGTLTINGILFSQHTHTQAPDSAGNTEQNTGVAI